MAQARKTRKPERPSRSRSRQLQSPQLQFQVSVSHRQLIRQRHFPQSMRHFHGRPSWIERPAAVRSLADAIFVRPSSAWTARIPAAHRVPQLPDAGQSGVRSGVDHRIAERQGQDVAAQFVPGQRGSTGRGTLEVRSSKFQHRRIAAQSQGAPASIEQKPSDVKTQNHFKDVLYKNYLLWGDLTVSKTRVEA